jgi:hypothetical protein
MSGDLCGFASLPLSEAVFCADCEMISNSKNVCRCCGSTALMVLSQLMGGSLRNVQRAVVIEWVQNPRPTRVAIEFSNDSEAAAA